MEFPEIKGSLVYIRAEDGLLYPLDPELETVFRERFAEYLEDQLLNGTSDSTDTSIGLAR